MSRPATALLPLLLFAALPGQRPVPDHPAGIFTLGAHRDDLEPTLVALDARVAEQADIDRDAREVAWTLLAYSGTGTGMRHGRHRDAVKTLTKWLRDALAREVPYALDAETPRDVHLLAAFAMARTCIEADYKLLQRATTAGCAAALARFEADGAPPPTTREAALLTLLAQTLLPTRKWQVHASAALALAREAVAEMPVGRDRFGDAVRHHLERLGGAKPATDLTVALYWPGDPARDPVHTWFAAYASLTLPPKAREAHWPTLAPLLTRRGDDDLWPESGGLDRHTTSALLAGALGMSHRPGGFVPGEPAPLPKAVGDPWQEPIKGR